jgi:hypothetical protein
MSQDNWKRYVTMNDLTRAAWECSKAASVDRSGSNPASLDEKSMAALQRWREMGVTMLSAERRLLELEMAYALQGELPISMAKRLAAARADFVGQPRWTVERVSSRGWKLVDLSWVIREGRQGELGNGIVAIRYADICMVERMIVVERAEDIIRMVLRTPGGEEDGKVLSEDLQPGAYAKLLRKFEEDAELSLGYIDLTVNCKTVEEMLPCLTLAEAVDRGEPGPEIPVPNRSELTSRLSQIDPISGRQAAVGSLGTVYDLALEHGLIDSEQHFAVYSYHCNTWNYCGD